MAKNRFHRLGSSKGGIFSVGVLATKNLIVYFIYVYICFNLTKSWHARRLSLMVPSMYLPVSHLPTLGTHYLLQYFYLLFSVAQGSSQALSWLWRVKKVLDTRYWGYCRLHICTHRHVPRGAYDEEKFLGLVGSQFLLHQKIQINFFWVFKNKVVT
jgi:hypothetical protein